MHNIEQQKNNLLLATLPHVSHLGWSKSALEKACADLTVPITQAEILFPGGHVEMILWYSDYADQEMQKTLAGEKEQLSGLKAKVFRAIQIRLQQNAIHREAVRQGLVTLLLPWNQPKAMNALYKTVDRIWRGIDHHPTDFSFYTKRLTLAGVYSSTLFYWLQDYSDNYQKTWDFLTRRLQDLGKIPVLRQKLTAAAAYIPSPVRLWQKLRQHN